MSHNLDDAIASLDDYVRGYGTEEEAAAYEEDLFARAVAGNAPELSFREGLTRSLRKLRDAGTLNVWLTGRDAEALVASNPKAQSCDLDLKNLPVVREDAELLVTRIPLNLTGVRQLDVEVLDEQGRVLKVMPEVPFDPADGAVYACCEADLARATTSSKTISRIWATDEEGRRLLATIPIGL